jgi:GTP cyclohydrolase II
MMIARSSAYASQTFAYCKEIEGLSAHTSGILVTEWFSVPVILSVSSEVKERALRFATRRKNCSGRNWAAPVGMTAHAMAKETHGNKAKLNGKGEPRLVAQAELPTRYGRFTIFGFEGRGPQEEAVALVRGNLRGRTAPLVRVHSQCLTGDVLTSQRCDCRAQLELSLKKIAQSAAGVLLYLPQEGRGIGLMNKLRAYELQDRGMDTVEANESLGFAADAREYDFPAQILKKLGATRIRLLSNNPDKVQQLESAGVRVVERVPCQPRISKISRAYLQTKKHKMGHLLEGL